MVWFCVSLTKTKESHQHPELEVWLSWHLYCGFAVGDVTYEAIKLLRKHSAEWCSLSHGAVWKPLASGKCGRKQLFVITFIWTLSCDWDSKPDSLRATCAPEPFTLNGNIVRKLKQNWLFSYIAGRCATKEIVLYAPKTKMTFRLCVI